MKFSCEQCHAQYMIADEKVGQKGVKVKCKKCGNIIVVKPRSEGEAAAAAAAPEAAHAPAPSEGNGAQMPGAFDSLFGGGNGAMGGGGGGDELNLGSLAGQAAPQAPEPSRRPAGDKEWYVAIDDSQVGPIDTAEIEERWDKKELDEDSLAWKAGMSDWVPVAEIPELAYLITERPQEKPQARAPMGGGGGMGAAAGMMAAGGGSGPVSFGGGPAAMGEEVSWKPSAASALSSLVQEELVAADKPKEVSNSQASAGASDMGMPSFGAGDLFGGTAANGGASRAPDPFAAPAPSWQVPTTPRRDSGGPKGLYILVGVLGLGLLGLGAFVVLKPSAPQQVIVQQPTQPGQPGNAQAQKPEPTKPDRVAKPDPKPDPKPDRGSKEEPKKVVKTDPKPDNKKAPKDDIDDLLRDSGPKKGPVKASLSRDDIMAGVKTNSRTVGPCLQAARGKNEIVPGEYKFILDWTIKTDGSIGGAHMKGPSNVMGTSLPACFASAMRKWQFPASQKETPITNFPFGPIRIK